ncbi:MULTISPECIES: DUF397 domain-containing protein [unclassified Streptomyces]|uniref:DUF397 domain-containing protein n=1 Tax=unclassified Streptomyces TaxID=2593676 RepID=UPI003369F905
MRDKSELMAQDVPEDAWTKSSFSGGGSGGDCLEVAKLRGGVALRDSENPGMRIYLTDAEYRAYTQGVQAREPGLVL